MIPKGALWGVTVLDLSRLLPEAVDAALAPFEAGAPVKGEAADFTAALAASPSAIGLRQVFRVQTKAMPTSTNVRGTFLTPCQVLMITGNTPRVNTIAPSPSTAVPLLITATRLPLPV